MAVNAEVSLPARPLWRPLAAARALPVAVWLAAIVFGSIALQYAFARRAPGPWIMVDELIYSELAKSFAATGDFLVRGHPANGFGVVYPMLISPAWAYFQATPAAYAAAKVINVVAMSSTALPAYFLARRIARAELALVAAALAVAVPSTLYAGTIMSENAFYPLFVWLALALVVCLERPTRRRQLLVLAFCLLAFLTRTQAIVLAPAVALAPALLGVVQGCPRSVLRRFRVLYATLGAVCGAVLLAELLAGKSLLAVLGPYRVAGEHHYSPATVLRWLAYHVAELDLYVGIAPLVALVILLALARRLDPAAQAFVAAAVPLVGLLLLEVATFSTLPPVRRVEERNMFYVAPLLFTALVAWVERGAPRPRVATKVAVIAAAVLPGVLPYRALIDVSAKSDTLALLAWWWLEDNNWVRGSEIPAAAVLLSALLAALVLLVPTRRAIVVPVVVLAYLAAMLAAAEYGRNGFRNTARGTLFQGITAAAPNWIDRSLPSARDAVATVWSGRASVFTLWETEFFNRRVGPVLELGAPPGGGLPATAVSIDRASGFFLDRNGRNIRTAYALADGTVPLDGTKIASDSGRGMVLYRVHGPLREAQLVDGLYPDGWSGRRVEYTRFDCAGGRVETTIQSDPRLFTTTQAVVIRAGGGIVAATRLAPRATRTLAVPLVPDAAHRCKARFEVSRTAVPARAELSSLDRRALGLRFLGFRYLSR